MIVVLRTVQTNRVMSVKQVTMIILYRLLVNSGFTMHSPMLHSFRSGVSLRVIVNTINSSGHAVIGFVRSGTM